MYKMLPFGFSPINSFPKSSMLLSILWHDNYKEKILPWFCDNFIQLIAIEETDKNNVFFNFYDIEDRYNKNPFIFQCGFIRTQQLIRNSLYGIEPISSESIKSKPNISEFIKYQVKKDNYVILSLNNYYIKSMDNYLKYNNNAPYMIYGYDNDDFNFSGFINGVYSNNTMHLNELNDSYNNHAKEPNHDGNLIHLFKYNNTAKYETSYHILKTYISDYVNCVDSFKKFNKRNDNNLILSYGLDVYNKIVNEHENDLDIRRFHVLYNHKIAMTVRINYFIKANILNISDYERLSKMATEIQNKALLLKNIALKYKNPYS